MIIISGEKYKLIDDIVNDFKSKLLKLERNFILIQERRSYFNSKGLVALLTLNNNKKKLEDQIELLDNKIN